MLNQRNIQELQDRLVKETKSLARASNDPKRHHVKAKTLVELGDATGDQKYYEQALENYNEAIKLTNGEKPSYLVNRAKLHVKTGKIDLAFEDIKSASSLPKQGDLEGDYVNDVKEEIAKLGKVQERVEKWIKEGKLSPEDNFVKDFNQNKQQIIADITDGKENEKVLKLMQDLERKFEVKFQEMGGRIDEVKDIAVDVESRVIDVEERLNMIEPLTLKMKKDLENKVSKEEYNSLLPKIEGLSSSVAVISKQLPEHDERLKKITASMLTLQDKSAVNEDDVNSLYDLIEGIKKSLPTTVVTNMVTCINHNNKLLDHFDLVKKVSKKFNANDVLNLSTELDFGLIQEAIRTKDSDLILAGLISVLPDEVA